MIYEFLTPVSGDIVRFVLDLPDHTIGKNLKIHSENNLPDFEDVQIAILTINDSRVEDDDFCQNIDFDVFRRNLYSLFPGNWSSVIMDLGTIKGGETIEDTYFVVRKIVEDLYKKNILPVILGASQDITYACYRAYDQLDQMVNLTTIDSKIDVVNNISNPSPSFITRMIMDEPNNLLNFCNLGYQTYFNSQEELDLIEKMYFEAYRLGDLIKNIHIAEPILRDSDVVSLDLQSIRGADIGVVSSKFPNGLDGREVCTLARYAGISDRVSIFGLFGINKENMESLLIPQIIWYFVEGFNFRLKEYPYISKKSYYKYIVPTDEQTLVFYKSDVSDRWWIQVGDELEELDVQQQLFPCSYSDYEKALNNIVPDRWWKLRKKI